MRIAYRILLTLFVVTTISTGMIAFSVAYLGRATVRHTIEARQLDATQATMDKIDRFMAERTGDVRAVALRSTVREAAAGTLSDVDRTKLAADLADLAGIYGGAWSRFAVLDSAGDEVVASGEELPTGGINEPSDPGEKPLFAQAMSGSIGYSDVFTSDKTKGLSIVIMAPIPGDSGKPIGAVEGYVDYHSVLDILSETTGTELHLLDKDGLEIGTNVQADLGEVLVEDYSTNPTYELLMSMPGQSVVTENLHGTAQVLASHVHDMGFGSYPGAEWSLTSETPISAAFAESDRTVIYSVLIAYVSGMLGLVAIMFIVSRAVIAPIERLTDATRRLAAGDLEGTVPAKGGGELTELGAAFNSMAGKLRASYRGLEDRVRERTADLERAKSELEARNVTLEQTKRAMTNLLEDIERGRDAAVGERARFETLLSSIGDGVLVTEADGTLTYANSTASALTGFRIKDVLGMNLMYLAESVRLDGTEVPEKDRPLYKALHLGLTDKGEYLYRRSDRSQFPASVTSSPVIVNGKIAGSITVFRDISSDLEEKRLIEEQKARYEALLSSVADGVVAVDKDGKTIYVNEAVERLTGFKAQEVMGNRWDAIEQATDEKGAAIPKERRTVDLALTTMKPQFANFWYVRKDKSRFPIAAATSPVVVQGKLVAAVTVFRDITKEMQVDKAKTEFVSLASHQLKTPLAAVRWYLELVTGGEAGKLTKAQKEYLGEIGESVAHMNNLVNALLNVSRIELGTFTIEPEPSDILKLADEAASELMPQVKAKKIAFAKDYGKGLPTIPLDPGLTNIIVQNMLSNAVKYTPAGGKVSIRIARAGEDVEIDVSDTGMGITKGQQERIFSRMFRADNAVASQTEGTGLGLYLVKSILDVAGGRIWFESEEGKGSTFHVAIPLSGMKRKEGTRRLT